MQVLCNHCTGGDQQLLLQLSPILALQLLPLSPVLVQQLLQLYPVLTQHALQLPVLLPSYLRIYAVKRLTNIF